MLEDDIDKYKTEQHERDITITYWGRWLKLFGLIVLITLPINLLYAWWYFR